MAAPALGFPERTAALEVCRPRPGGVDPARPTRTVGLPTLSGAFVGRSFGGVEPARAGVSRLPVLIGLLAPGAGGHGTGRARAHRQWSRRQGRTLCNPYGSTFGATGRYVVTRFVIAARTWRRCVFSRGRCGRGRLSNGERSSGRGSPVVGVGDEQQDSVSFGYFFGIIGLVGSSSAISNNDHGSARRWCDSFSLRLAAPRRCSAGVWWVVAILPSFRDCVEVVAGARVVDVKPKELPQAGFVAAPAG